MTDYDYNKLKAQLAILRDVEKDYPTATIFSAIVQIEARVKLYETKQEKEQKQ